jgi:hypothetical protein
MSGDAGGRQGRALAAYALVVVIALLTPVAILGTWTSRHVVSTQGYVDTVGPLSSDVRVQTAVEDAVTTAIVKALPSSLSSVGVTKATATTLVDAAVTQVVEGSTFHALWITANRAAQSQVLAELRAPEASSKDSVALNLGPIAEAVRLQLVANGLTVLNSVRFDTTGKQAVLNMPTGQLSHAHRWWSVYESSMRWLTPLLLVLAGLALLIAPRRRRVLLAEAVALLVAVGLSALVTAIGHRWYGQRLSGAAAANAARAVGDVLVSSVDHLLRDLTIVALVIAVLAAAALAIPRRRPS